MKHLFYTLAATLATVLAMASCDKSDEIIIPTPTPDNPDTPSAETVIIEAGADGSLGGVLIGTRYSVDYSTGERSETVNTKQSVFDRNFDTFFASNQRSGTWVGLDLGEKHVITKIGYSPRIGQAGRVQLAVIEGANEADFSDAMPIYLIPEPGVEREMNYAEINCSRGFRYVRYMTPYNVRCNLAELAFYGTKGEGDDSKLYQITNLPLVVINTAGNAEIESKEYEITSTVYVIGEDGTYLHTDRKTGVRGRGNASWNFPKKPYRLKFDKKVNLLGAPAKAKKWTLINNYGDKSLLRNILAFEISRRVGLEYTPFCQPVDVVLNGEYRGCYQLCDQIEVDEGRVDITEMEPSDNADEALSGGYLIEIDAYAESEASYFWSKRGIPVTIKSPDDDEITERQADYIKDYFNRMEQSVFGTPADRDDFTKFLDLDSFLRHFIVGELSGNTDTYWSVYMSKDRGSDQFKTGPVWDFDIAFDNDIRTYPVNGKSDFVYTVGSAAGGDVMKNFVNQIIKNNKPARERLEELWSEMRASGEISVESLTEYINQTAQMLQASQRLNFLRWPILDQMIHENPQALGSFNAEVGTVRSFIKGRIPFMDQRIISE